MAQPRQCEIHTKKIILYFHRKSFLTRLDLPARIMQKIDIEISVELEFYNVLYSIYDCSIGNLRFNTFIRQVEVDWSPQNLICRWRRTINRRGKSAEHHEERIRLIFIHEFCFSSSTTSTSSGPRRWGKCIYFFINMKHSHRSKSDDNNNNKKSHRSVDSHVMLNINKR